MVVIFWNNEARNVMFVKEVNLEPYYVHTLW
jgi:hypothetical protein